MTVIMCALYLALAICFIILTRKLIELNGKVEELTWKYEDTLHAANEAVLLCHKNSDYTAFDKAMVISKIDEIRKEIAEIKRAIDVDDCK